MTINKNSNLIDKNNKNVNPKWKKNVNNCVDQKKLTSDKKKDTSHARLILLRKRIK